MNNEILLEDFLFIDNSKIEGKGLFTSIQILENQKILVISGEVIDEDECLRREIEENNVYIFWNDHSYIDTANTKKIKFINHSCKPNCYVASRDENSLYLVAATNIIPNEELTIDYGYEEIYADCKCDYCKSTKIT